MSKGLKLLRNVGLAIIGFELIDCVFAGAIVKIGSFRKSLDTIDECETHDTNLGNVIEGARHAIDITENITFGEAIDYTFGF